MKYLILNQIYLSLNKRRVTTVTLVLMLLNVTQFFMIVRDSSLENVKITQTDFILKMSGGVQRPFFIFQFIQWATIIAILILLIQTTTTIMEEFDLILLTRANTRIKWWLGKVISLLIITFCYSILFTGIQKFIALIFLPRSVQWSKYAYIYYPQVCIKEVNPQQLEYITFLILLTGFIALATMFQTVNYMFNNNIKSYIVIIISLILLYMTYTSGLISRVFSPMHYASTLDMVPSMRNYITQMAFNTCISIISIFIGFIVVRKKDYVNFVNY